MNIEKAIHSLIDACVENPADAALLKADAALTATLKREVTKLASSMNKNLESAKKAHSLRDFMEKNGLSEAQVKKLLASGGAKAPSRPHPIYEKGPDAITSFLGVFDSKAKSMSKSEALAAANKQFGYTGPLAIKEANLKTLRSKAKKA